MHALNCLYVANKVITFVDNRNWRITFYHQICVSILREFFSKKKNKSISTTHAVVEDTVGAVAVKDTDF